MKVAHLKITSAEVILLRSNTRDKPLFVWLCYSTFKTLSKEDRPSSPGCFFMVNSTPPSVLKTSFFVISTSKRSGLSCSLLLIYGFNSIILL